MKSPIYRKLVVTGLALLALAMVLCDCAIRRYGHEQETAAVRARLESTGRRMALLAIRAGAAPAISEVWCRDGERVELVDGIGRLLPGCDGGTAANGHADRVEVTMGTDGMRDVRALKLSAELEDDPKLDRLRFAIAAILAGTGCVALFIAYFVSRSLARRVLRLRLYAEALLDGPAPETWPREANDELGTLERTLHRVAAQLRQLFEHWSLESSRSEAILSGLAEGVLAVDHDLRVIFSNQAVTRALGLRTPPRERMPVLEFMRDSELAEILKSVVISGESVKRNVKIAAARGRAFEVQARPLAVAGGRGALAIFYDMTDIERLEQVRKDFVANVSHEMRTPLASIVGYSETLLDGGLEDPDHNRKFVDVIRSNAIRLNSIASDLLVLSELESGENPGEPDSISVRDTLENAMAMVEPEARSRNIQMLRGEIHESCVSGYRFRLEQAMSNLLVNAVKFNREGGQVRVEAVAATDGKVRIAVSDTGAGIPSQDLPRIFERFYRVDKARSRQVGGTGLGLSIVRHVVERMNGSIEVESQLGKGSTFTVILPTC